jgi:hypothetical protein
VSNSQLCVGIRRASQASLSLADLTIVGRSGRITGSALALAASVLLGGTERAVSPVDRAIQPALVQPRGATSVAARLLEGTVVHAIAGRGYDIDATGFARSADIDLELVNSPWQGSTRADVFGRVSVRFVVPADLAAGTYQLSLTGPIAAPDPTQQVGRGAAVATDHATVRPRVEIFRFTVV